MKHWLKACVRKNILAGMTKDQAIRACTGARGNLQQASTKWKRTTAAAAMKSVPGSAGGEFNSGFGVTFGPSGQPISYGGQAPTGQGVGTGNTTGAGAMTASKTTPLAALLHELRALLK